MERNSPFWYTYFSCYNRIISTHSGKILRFLHLLWDYPFMPQLPLGQTKNLPIQKKPQTKL